MSGFEKWWRDHVGGVALGFPPAGKPDFQDCYSAARREALAEMLPCGHPLSCLRHTSWADTEGPAIMGPSECAWCADLQEHDRVDNEAIDLGNKERDEAVQAAKEGVREACRQVVWDFMNLTKDFATKYGTPILENAVANIDLFKTPTGDRK